MDIQAIASNPYFSIGGVVISVVSVALAIVFYLRAKKEKLPRWYADIPTVVVGQLQQSIEGLQIYYKGNLIPRIAVTNIAFWNDGKETIKGADVAQTQPLEIRADEGTEILDVRLLYQTADANRFQVTQRGQTGRYALSFDFIDYKDGAIFSVVHKDDDDIDYFCKIFLDGRIVGAAYKYISFSDQIPKDMKPHFGHAVAMAPNSDEWPIFLMFIFLGVWGLWNVLSQSTSWYHYVAMAFGMYCTLIGFHFFYRSWQARKKASRSRNANRDLTCRSSGSPQKRGTP